MIGEEYGYRQEWDNSYSNGDNNILYPQAEVIRFLNRYIRKRNSDGSISDVMPRRGSQQLRGLDFACGVGTHCSTFKDFEIDGYGVDISQVAIAIAQKNGALRNIPNDRYKVLNDRDQVLPFDDQYFDFVVAESCLDSMPYAIAKKYVRELKRVTRGYIYASFIGWDPSIASDEFVVETEHEKGTVQTVFDEAKIAELLDVERDNFKLFRRIDQIECKSGDLVACRYYCVIEII
jgi:SAM-dependent methyltransferase